MAGMKALLLLAFMGSIGMAFVIIPCLVRSHWTSIIVVVFYILSPLPTLMAHGYSNDPRTNYMDLAIFITMCIVVSAYGLPIVLTHAADSTTQWAWTDCFSILFGNTIIFATFVGYFLTLFQDTNSGGYF